MHDFVDRKPGVTALDDLLGLVAKAYGDAEAHRIAVLDGEDRPRALHQVLAKHGEKLAKQIGYPVTAEEVRALARDFDRIGAEINSLIDHAGAVEVALASVPGNIEEAIATGLVDLLDRATRSERAKAALAVLKKIFPPGSRLGLVSLPSEGGGPTSGAQVDPHSADDEADAMDFLQTAGDRGENVYVHTNPLKAATRGFKARDADIERRLHAILDFDAKDILKGCPDKTKLREKLLARAKRALTRLGTSPKAEIWSGGGVHQWYGAGEDFDKEAWGEACKALGSDPVVRDPSRIARLPYSLNYPNKKKRTNEGRGITLAYPLSAPAPDAPPVAMDRVLAVGASVDRSIAKKGKSTKKIGALPSVGVEVHSDARRHLDAFWPLIEYARGLNDLPEPPLQEVKDLLSFDNFVKQRFEGHAGPLHGHDGVKRIEGFTDGDRSAASLSMITLARRAGASIEATAALAVCHEFGELRRRDKYTNDADRKRQFLRCWTKGAPATKDDLQGVKGKPTQIRRAENGLLNTPSVELWRSRETGDRCITIPHLGGGVRHYRLMSTGCHEAIFALLRRNSNPSAQLSLKRIKDELSPELAAICASASEYPSAVRSGSVDDWIYLSMADDRGRVIVVSDLGWGIGSLEDSPICFLSNPALQPLVDPEGQRQQHGFLRLLRHHVSLPPRLADDRNDPGVRAEASVLMFLTAAARRVGTLPHLALGGPAGAGKTIMARRLKSVFDPDRTMESGAPKDVQSLVALARNQGIPVLDNLSRIGPDLSDALCGLATGTSLTSRKLYTDGDFSPRGSARGVIVARGRSTGPRGPLRLVFRFLRVALVPISIRVPESQLEERLDGGAARDTGGIPGRARRRPCQNRCGHQ